MTKETKKIEKQPNLCDTDGCYAELEPEDLVLRPDGTFHPVSRLCWNCRTPEEQKQLKNYKKNRRKAKNKLEAYNERISD